MLKKNNSVAKRIISLLLSAAMVMSSTVTSFAEDGIANDSYIEGNSDSSVENETQQNDEEDPSSDTTGEPSPDEDTSSATTGEPSPDEELSSDTTGEPSPDEDASSDTTGEPSPDEDTTSDSSEEITEESDDEKVETTELYHYVSSFSSEGVLPYEYYFIDDDSIEPIDIGFDSITAPNYNLSDVKYNGSASYNALTAAEKEIYNALYYVADLIDCSSSYSAEYKDGDYYLPAVTFADSLPDGDMLFRAFVALTHDNPQFFWMGHYYSYGTKSGKAYIRFGIDVSANDYADGSYRMEVKAELYDEIEYVLDNTEAYGNEYTKEWYVHNYLCEATVYDGTGPHAHDVTGLLLDGKAVCESYAKCFQLFMNALDIDVMYISGKGNGGAHGWNQVGLDNNGVTEWYNVDVTWDDNSDGTYDYNYFNVVDSDGTVYDFTNGYVSNGKQYNAHVPHDDSHREYLYDAYTCNSTTYSYKNHNANYKLASIDPVAKIGETEYTSLDAAISASVSGDTITLIDDVSYNGITMPAHAITIDAAGYDIEFNKDMDLCGNLTIDNLGGYTSEELYTDLDDLSEYSCIFLNGNTLNITGAMDGYIPAYVSGSDEDDNATGTLAIDLDSGKIANFIEIYNVKTLTIEDNEYVNSINGVVADNVTIGSNSKLAVEYGAGVFGNLTVGNNSWLMVTTDAFDPVFEILGDITGDIVNVSAANLDTEYASVITAEKYSVDLFNFVYPGADGDIQYKVSRELNDHNLYLYIPCLTADYTVSFDATSVQRCTMKEAVEWIDEQKDASKDYTITYTGDNTNLIINNDLTFGNANSITFDGANINLTGDITLNTDIAFDYGATFRGVVYGNDHIIRFADDDTTSGFNGAYAENLNVIVLNSSVSFLDDNKSGNNIQLNTLSLDGDAEIGYSAVDKLTVGKLCISDINNDVTFNSGKAEIGDIICDGSCAFNIKNGDVLTVNGNIFNGNPIEFYSENPQSGQKLITVSEDISWFFTTNLQNENGKTYSVIYREGALVLDIPVFYLEDVGIYSQWSDILSYINKNGSSDAEFKVQLLDDVVLDSLTLPAATKAKSLDFIGGYEMALNSTTLSVPTNVTFDCTLVAENTSVTVAKDMKLEIAYGNVKALTGTATSTLCGFNIKTDSVKTFGTIFTWEPLKLSGSMSGITNFDGTLVLNNPESTVSITNIMGNSEIFYQTGDTLPKVTVSNIADGKTLTINVNDGAALENGTTVLYCTSDISDKVSIENTTSDSKTLSPIYYASTKSIKAEDASALTLTARDSEGKETSRNFPNIDLALAAIKDSESDYTITLNQELTLDKLTLPKTAKSITFSGEALTFTGTALSIPVNTTFNCDLSAPDTALTVAAKTTLTFEDNDSKVKSIKGTATSELAINKLGRFPVNDITTFNRVNSENFIYLSGNMTGVNNFSGMLATTSASCVVTIKNIESEDNRIWLFPENGKLPKVTLTSFSEGAKLRVSVSDFIAGIETVDSGTTLLYTTGNDLSEYITIVNQTPDEKDLTAFYYAKTKSIKAEWAGALTLKTTDSEGKETSRNFPNIDLALAAIKDSESDYEIILNQEFTLDKLTLPKTAKSITFGGEALTFTGTALSIPVNTTFNCDLSAPDTAVTVAAKTTLTFENWSSKVKSIKGTATSELVVANYCSLSVNDITTFNRVNTNGSINLNGNMTGVNNFSGILYATSASCVVTIKNIESGENYIYLFPENGKLPKVTLTSFSEGAILIVDVYDLLSGIETVDSGTTLLYTTGEDLSEYITIVNKTPDEKDLTAFYYAKTKSIKAEWAGALTLTARDSEGKETSRDFPNIDLALAAIKDSESDYTITLNQELTLDKLTLPKTAKSIAFEGYSITFTGKTLSIPVNTTFFCEFSAPDTDLTVAAKTTLTFENWSSEVKSIKGTATSELVVANYCSLSVNDITTFNRVNTNGYIYLSGKMTGVNNFSGELVTTSASCVVTINNIEESADIYLFPENGKLPKVTLTSFSEGAKLRVGVNDLLEVIETVDSGTTLLYTTGKDLSEYITIGNLTPDGKALNAFYYAKTKSIKAEWANAVTVTYGDEPVNLPNMDKVFELINANKDNTADYTIKLNTPLTVSTLTIPKYANSITFEGSALTYTGKSISVPVTTAFNCELICTVKDGITVSVPKDKTLTLSKVGEGSVKSVSGTKTSSLILNDDSCDDIVIGSITGFGNVSGYVTVTNTMNITNLVSGAVTMTNPKGKLDIAKIEGADTKLYINTEDVLPKVTVVDMGETASLVININNSVALKGNETILYTKGKDISDKISFENRTNGDKVLTAYYYAKTKSIKAEWSDAFTLYYDEVEQNLPNIDKVFEVITENKDKTKAYTIKINAPITLSALNIPAYAKSITFSGSELTFTGKTLKLPVKTIFNCTLNAENTALTASKNLALSNASVKSITGTKTSVLNMSGDVATADIKTFASVYPLMYTLTVSGTMSGIGSFEGDLTAGVKSNITLTSCERANIRLVTDATGAIGKVTINGATGNIEVTVVDENGATVSLASGTQLLNAPSDITGNITVANKTTGSKTLSPVYNAKKKAVYAEYLQAVTVSYSTANGDVNENYSSFEKAFAAIPVSAEGININLNCDVVTESFTVPKFVNGLNINGLEKTVTLKNLTSISLTVPVTFNDITIDSTKPFRISTTSDLTLSSFASSTLSRVSGGAKKTLTYNGENNVNYTVSGFGNLDLTAGPVLNITKAVTVKNVIADNSPTLGIMSGANVKLTTVDSDGISSDELVIMYYDGATTPVSISGVITGNIFFTHETNFTDGQHVLTAAKADLACLSFEPENKPDERDFTFTRKSGKIYLKAIAFEVSDGDKEYRYAEWADFVAMVNAAKNAEASYSVTLMGDYNVGGALTMPKAGTYKQIRIMTDVNHDGNATLKFTGGITQTGELIFRNIALSSVNTRGVETAYTIKTGAYMLSSYNTNFGKIASISGSKGSIVGLSGSVLDGKLSASAAVIHNSSVAGAVSTTSYLTVSGNAAFKNTVNAYGLMVEEDSTIVLTKGKLLTVGKGGTGSTVLTVDFDEEITAKTKIGTVPVGYYNNNFIGSGFDIVVEKNILYAVPII